MELNATTSAGGTAAAAAAAALSQSRAGLSDKQDAAAPPAQEACNPEPHPSATPHNSQGLAAEATEASKNAEPSTAPVTERKHEQKKEELQPKHAAGTAGVKALKPRKKDFLKRRKLKKKGLLHLLDKEPEEDLEAELMQDRHKPKFGEQAMAPLKARSIMLA